MEKRYNISFILFMNNKTMIKFSINSPLQTGITIPKENLMSVFITLKGKMFHF